MNYKQLNQLLLQLGYSAHKAEGGQIVYRHSRNDSLLAIKHAPANQIVPRAVVAAIVQNVLYTNVAPEKKIRKWAAAHAA